MYIFNPKMNRQMSLWYSSASAFSRFYHDVMTHGSSATCYSAVDGMKMIISWSDAYIVYFKLSILVRTVTTKNFGLRKKKKPGLFEMHLSGVIFIVTHFFTSFKSMTETQEIETVPHQQIPSFTQELHYDLEKTRTSEVCPVTQPSQSMPISEPETLDIEHVPVQNDPRKWSSLRKVKLFIISICFKYYI